MCFCSKLAQVCPIELRMHSQISTLYFQEMYIDDLLTEDATNNSEVREKLVLFQLGSTTNLAFTLLLPFSFTVISGNF